MKFPDRFYPNLFYVVLVLFLLSFVAFNPGYFSKVKSTLPWFMHGHYILMVAWMGMFIIQPWLIKTERFRLHRKIGKISYGLGPLVLISIFLMLRHGYASDLEALRREIEEGAVVMTDEAAVHLVRTHIALGFFYFLVLLIFYPLAIINRKTPLVHARYMTAAALSMVGPIVDRALYVLLRIFHLPNKGIEYISFCLIDVLLISMLYHDYKTRHSPKVVLICTSVFVLGQIVYSFFLDSSLWQNFVGFLLAS